MKQVLSTISICLLALFSNAQQSPIMVCNTAGSSCNPYYNLDSAYFYAVAGDIIYLPGGVFTLNQNISKQVQLIGAGSHVDSTAVTGITTINGNITFTPSGSNSTLEGIYMSGNILTTGGAVSNLSIKHMNFHKAAGSFTSCNFKWSVFRTGSQSDNDFNNGINNTVTNCFLYGLYNFHSGIVDQCTGIYYSENWNFSTVKNSILYYNGYSYFGQYGSNNTISNNVYHTSCGSQCINRIYNNNNIQESVTNTMVIGSITISNFKVKSTSVAKTASQTGGECGAYGGSFPYKEGAVPSNPHLFLKNISSITNANGDLPVQVKSRAEDY